MSALAVAASLVTKLAGCRVGFSRPRTSPAAHPRAVELWNTSTVVSEECTIGPRHETLRSRGVLAVVRGVVYVVHVVPALARRSLDWLTALTRLSWYSVIHACYSGCTKQPNKQSRTRGARTWEHLQTTTNESVLFSSIALVQSR
jgi:hypothetical protein